MLGHFRLVDGAGIVIEAAGDGQVDGEILLRDAEVLEVLRHGNELVKPLIKGLVHAAIALQRGDDLGVGAGDGHEVEHILRLAGQHLHLVDKELAHLFRADLIELVDDAHNVARALAHAVHGIEAVEELAVIDLDLELCDAEGREGAVDDGGYLGLVDYVELAVADDVDIGLIELAETAALGALAAVDLAYLIAAEREGQLGIMRRDVFRQRHGQVKAQRKVAVALGEAVYLLLGLAAALGQKHLGGLYNGSVERGEAVDGIGLAQDAHHALKLHLRSR